jgi:hypothetical protein
LFLIKTHTYIFGKGKQSQNEKRWQYHLKMEPTFTSPACQIHHTHHDHWICSIFYNEIYLLGNDRENIIPDGLKIQLSQIYSRNLKSISILLFPVFKNKQCRLWSFAIAFATHFCLNEKLSLDTIF